MNQILGNSVAEMTARSSVRGNQALHMVRSLGSGAGTVTAGGDAEQGDAALREQIGELVGVTFYGTLLKTMRTGALKGSFGHGGRGEEVFQNHLDMLLAQRAGRARQFELNEAIYRTLKKGSDRTTEGSNIQ